MLSLRLRFLMGVRELEAELEAPAEPVAAALDEDSMTITSVVMTRLSRFPRSTRTISIGLCSTFVYVSLYVSSSRAKYPVYFWFTFARRVFFATIVPHI